MICETCKFKDVTVIVNSINGEHMNYYECKEDKYTFRNVFDDTCPYYRKEE